MSSAVVRFIRGYLQGPTGPFFMRQSLPGYDARYADVTKMIFDANFRTGYILGKNALTVPAAAFTSPFWGTGQATQAHGLGRKPDAVIAVGAIRNNADNTLNKWRTALVNYTPNGPQGTAIPSVPDVSPSYEFEGKYASPFIFYSYTGAGSPAQAAASGTTGQRVEAGWRLFYDATNIKVISKNPSPNTHLHVLWTAFRFN